MSSAELHVCSSVNEQYGRNSCHVLTCVERYLAVVHPVTYLNLKGQRGAPQKQVTDEDMPKSSMTTMWKVKTSKGFMAAGRCFLQRRNPKPRMKVERGSRRRTLVTVKTAKMEEPGGELKQEEGVWEEFWEEEVLASMALKKRREGGEGKREGFF
ncbi:hypothetical protein F7725_004925 [Dissostichus mawsoni]|uniref:Uncharacterized protein n=1 Tax=Dissostichus mawsoni TaxID=36200 RepID=A0A7J5XKI4_DISMA|nr:hypothetical protein F7725_004925 [Dissostichus mawsoni]